MTTIAANRKEMAGDRKVTDDDTHFPSKKIYRVGEAIVGAAGTGPAISKFLKWLRKGDLDTKPKFDKDDELAALVLTPAGLFVYGADLEPEEVDAPFYAVGSGKQSALASMHLGCDPKKAVEVACLVDNNTGGPVDVLKLKS